MKKLFILLIFINFQLIATIKIALVNSSLHPNEEQKVVEMKEILTQYHFDVEIQEFYLEECGINWEEFKLVFFCMQDISIAYNYITLLPVTSFFIIIKFWDVINQESVERIFNKIKPQSSKLKINGIIASLSNYQSDHVRKLQQQIQEQGEKHKILFMNHDFDINEYSTLFYVGSDEDFYFAQLKAKCQAQNVKLLLSTSAKNPNTTENQEKKGLYQKLKAIDMGKRSGRPQAKQLTFFPKE